jgi:hypothetical protein
MLTRIVGDVHGKFDRYKKIIAECDRSIQVGDLGVGFRHTQGPRVGEIYGNPPHYAMVRGDHRFIRGNHDSPIECKKHSQFIPDGTVENDVMYIGGALSIDRAWRIEGYSYWSDEEASVEELNRFVDIYATVKPRVMITHECPESVAEIIGARFYRKKLEPEFASRTRQALQAMFEIHQPELHVFGHWHHSFDEVINGTRFICLSELEYRDVEL